MTKEEYAFMQRAYRHVFESEEGQMVLGDILSELGLFANQPAKIHPECIAVANTILGRLGLYNGIGENNVSIYMAGVHEAMHLAEQRTRDFDIKEEDEE